jgi:AraC-like DNA-binding protein
MPRKGKKISENYRRSQRFVGSSGFGIVTYRLGGRLGPRWQELYQLVVMHRGGAKLSVDGTTYSLRAGMGILLAPGHWEEFHFSRQREARHSWCQVMPGDLPASLRFPQAAFYHPAKCSARTMELIRCGLRLDSPTAGGIAGTQPVIGLVIAAMWAFVAGMAPDFTLAAPSGNFSVMARFQAELEKLGSEKTTLQEMARRSGVSSGHLIKLVRSHLGSTPMEAVWKARVSHAARLLKETGLTVAEVADQTGFANPYHFSRRFSVQFGQSPRRWRKEQLGRAAST